LPPGSTDTKPVSAKALPGFDDFSWIDIVKLGLAAVVIGGLSVSAVRGVTFLAQAEQYLTDLRLYALSPGTPEPHPDIVLVTITEETLATLAYRSPIDREFMANLIDSLQRKGAKALGIDILFDQPTIKEKDDQLRQALDQWPAPPVVAWAAQAEGLSNKQVDYLSSFLDGLRVQRGFVTMMSDDDGTIRTIYPGRADDVTKEWRPGFPGAIAAQLGTAPPREPLGLFYQTRRDSLIKPVFREYDASVVADLPDTLLKGKIVLIGINLPDADRHRTPLAAILGHGAASLPGVLIHAQALSQILDGRQVPRVGGRLDFVMAILAAVVTMALVLVEARGLIKSAAWAGAVIGFIVLTSLPLYYGGPLLPMVAPLLALLGSMTVASAYAARHYRGQLRDMRMNLARLHSGA
jgi:adenylate cyclase